MGGKKSWYIVDGYRPPIKPSKDISYEGHECIMILNTNSANANVKINIYYEDKEPVEGIPLTVPAKRIFAFRSSDDKVLGGIKLDVSEQYSLCITSDVDIVVQYGRLDVQQSNLAYLALMGYSE